MSDCSTLLRLGGRDALSVLHRISTQKLDSLAPGEARVTLFCDFRGRLLHRAVVARTADAVWLVRGDAPGAPLAEHLARHVFREDVRIADLSADYPVVPEFHAQGVAGGFEVASGVPSHIVVEPGLALDLTGTTIATDAESQRIGAALPRHGHEIAEEFTPFDIGRAHEIHLNKGCFTGQEVLLRLITYGGQRRRLVRVSGSGAVPTVPADLVRDGQRVGRLTSAAAGASGWIGLAVVAKDVTVPEGLTLDGDGMLATLSLTPETRPLGLP
jgi:folate-binding protein YgfZ